MTEYLFDHDRLDVYRLSIEYVANAFDTSRLLAGLHRHARDQWLRAAQSIPLNIADGNGKRSLKDRAQIQARADCRDVNSDGDEIRWCLGFPGGVYSGCRLRARAPRC